MHEMHNYARYDLAQARAAKGVRKIRARHKKVCICINGRAEAESIPMAEHNSPPDGLESCGTRSGARSARKGLEVHPTERQDRQALDRAGSQVENSLLGRRQTPAQFGGKAWGGPALPPGWFCFVTDLMAPLVLDVK